MICVTIMYPNKIYTPLGITFSDNVVVNPFNEYDYDYNNVNNEDRSFKLISEYKTTNEINMTTKGKIIDIYFTNLKLNKYINKL